MKKRKHIFLVLITVIIALNINFHGNAISSEEHTTSLQWFPSLAADNDTVYIVWADERNGNYTRIMNNAPHKSGDIYISKASFQNGWVFDKNNRINEIKGTTGHGSPSITIDNNNVYAAWEDDRYGFEELYFSYSEKNNIKFKKDLPVIEEVGSQALPSISVRNGTVYAAMMNKKNWDIEFAEGYATNGVYRFDKPIRVNDDPAGNWHYAPSLAVDDEKNVCIAWLDARNSNYDIYFSHGIKKNGIWRFSMNIRVNDDSTNVSHYTPSLAFENGSAYIAWYDDRNKDLDIYFSKGRFENESWKFDSNIRVNDDEKGDQMHPEIAVRGSEIFIVWEDGRDGGSDIYLSNGVTKNGKLDFIKNIKINDIKGKHYDPQIVAGKSDVYVAWQAETPPHDDPEYGKYGTDGGDIYFSNGKYDGKTWEFGRNIKVNDDSTDSFAKPDPVLVGLLLIPVILSIIIVGFLRKYGKRKK